MTTLEAIYENGIFKPISSVPETLKEHARVRITIETDTKKICKPKSINGKRQAMRIF